MFILTFLLKRVIHSDICGQENTFERDVRNVPSTPTNTSRPRDVFPLHWFFFFFLKRRTMTKYVLASGPLFGYLELFPHRGAFDTSGCFHLSVVCYHPHGKTESWLPPAAYLRLVVSDCVLLQFSLICILPARSAGSASSSSLSSNKKNIAKPLDDASRSVRPRPAGH